MYRYHLLTAASAREDNANRAVVVTDSFKETVFKQDTEIRYTQEAFDLIPQRDAKKVSHELKKKNYMKLEYDVMKLK